MTVVKLCGLGSRDDVRRARILGADYAGIVFAPSRRAVTPATAAGWGSEHSRLVGVFTADQADLIEGAIAMCGIACVQLAGPGWSPQLVRQLVPSGIEILPVLHVGDDVGDALERARTWIDEGAHLVVLDGPVSGQVAGGHGVRIDAQVAGAVAREVPVLLAGGLTPRNVAEAIASVRPRGVDVSSGIEVHGRKDADMMRAFVEAARAAMVELEQP